MFKTEIYRIISRKVFLTALFAALLVTVYYSFFALWDEGVIDGENVYLREDAVIRDKEIAAEFAGPLTEETVRAIWDKYGAPVNYGARGATQERLMSLAGEGRYDNYCNRFVVRMFAEAVETEDGEISFVLKENLSENPYLQGDYVFGYVGSGWIRYSSVDWFLVPLIMSSLVVIIALSPAFSEDYAYRTADIILPAARGRMYLWWVRTGADCLFATVCYWILGMVFFGIQMVYYGGTGLQLRGVLVGLSRYWKTEDAPVWQLILQMYLAGWFSVIVLTFFVQAISARCRQSFASLLCSLCAYIVPFGIMRFVLDRFLDLGQLSMQKIIMMLRMVVWSMPLSYCSMMMDAPSEWRWRMTVIVSAAAAAAFVFGMRGYCRHQVES